MTAEEFKLWLDDMQAAGQIRSGRGRIQDAADLLGISRESMTLMMRRGTRQVQTDLACAALLRGIAPYSA